MPGKCTAICIAVKAKCGDCKVGAVIYVALQVIILLFTIFGVCFDQFRPRKEFKEVVPCISLWKVKTAGKSCISGPNTGNTKDLFPLCKKRSTRIKSAEGLGIVSIVLVLVALILGCIRLCCCSALRFVNLVLNIITIATLCVVWAQIAAIYNGNDFKKDDLIKDNACRKVKDIVVEVDGPSIYKYGSGFGLAVTAWCLQVINTIVGMLPC
ncbi:amastin-like protein [Angomonas deanei]|uniref:Amastin surface glycoprotein, putative n=1 Tax=Angomonas deanei TaxID=59799 RepID=S9W6J7_9TRYP|nr:amastin-like protein [Angomonas deanei]EPY31585.1 amastin-like protein [Angomonas deanei]CAD2218401.1 Amastin surface glycoprotein, putative [Angomonas deanei]|eukprot:EPY29177.1 amastin-like protein [Angomonas deanei]